MGGWKVGKHMEGLKLVSRQVRKQRLALWAAGRGPDPSFTAMVFWCCDIAVWRSTKASNGLPAVQQGKQMGGWKVGKRMEGLKLGSSESNVWHSEMPAAGPIRHSLPWCFGAATSLFGG